MNQFGAGAAILMCLAAACEGQIQVNIYNDAGVSDFALTIAEKAASRILHDAGITLSWCRRNLPGEPCAKPGPTTILVRLYADGHEQNFKPSANALGFALTSPAPEFGFFAGVFTVRVGKSGQRNGQTAGSMLGHVMAHEVGHLLLERSVHARRGLMKESWDRPEHNLIATGRLLFTSDDARRLRDRVKVRLSAVERASDGF